MTGEGPKKGGADGFGDLASTRGALDQLLERLNADAAGAPDADVHSGGPAASTHQTDVPAGGSVDNLLGGTPVAVVDAVPHHDAVAETAHIDAPPVVDGGTLIDNLLSDPVEQPLTDGHTPAAVDDAAAADPASFVAAEPDIAAGTGAPLAAAAGFSTLSDTFDPAEAQSQHVALQQHVGLILPAFRSALLRGLAQPVTTLQEAASLLSSNTTHFAGRTEIEAALPDLTLANRALPHAPKTATETARLRELNARLVVHHDALMKLFSAAPSPKPIDAVPETFTLADAPEDVKRAWAEYQMTFDGFNSRVALVNGQRVRFFKDDPRHQAVQDAQDVLHAEVAWQAPLRTGTLSRDTHTKKFFDQQRVALSVAQSKFDAVVTREEALDRHFSKDRCANILDRQVRTLATELGKVYKAFTGLDAKQDVAAIPEILAGITPYVPLGEGQRARDLEHAYRRAVESVSVLQTGGFPAVPVLNNTELLGLLSDAPDARRDLAVRSERALDAVQELLAIAQRNGPRTPAEVIALAQTIGRGVSNTDKGSSVYFYNPQTRAFEQRPIQSTDLNTPFGLMYGDVRVFPTKGLDTEYDSWLAEVQKAIPGYVDRQPQRDNASLESDISEVKFEAPAGAKAQGWIKSWIGSSWFGSGQPEAPAVVSGRTFEAEEYDEGEARLNNPANAKIREALDAWIAGATGTEQHERAQDRYLYVRIFGRRKQKPTDAERPTYERVTMAVADYEREKAKREAAQERNKKALAAYERQFSTEQKDELVRLSMRPVASGGISEKDFDELMGYYASAQAWQKVVSPDISLQGRIDAALAPWMQVVDRRDLAAGEGVINADTAKKDLLQGALSKNKVTQEERDTYVRVQGRPGKRARQEEQAIVTKVETVLLDEELASGRSLSWKKDGEKILIDEIPHLQALVAGAKITADEADQFIELAGREASTVQGKLGITRTERALREKVSGLLRERVKGLDIDDCASVLQTYHCDAADIAEFRRIAAAYPAVPLSGDVRVIRKHIKDSADAAFWASHCAFIEVARKQ